MKTKENAEPKWYGMGNVPLSSYWPPVPKPSKAMQQESGPAAIKVTIEGGPNELAALLQEIQKAAKTIDKHEFAESLARRIDKIRIKTEQCKQPENTKK